MGLGFQVLVGAEIAEATGDVEKTVEAVKKVREHAYLYAGLQTMEFLRRSGRVGWATAGIGALLQIKPMLQVTNGEVLSCQPRPHVRAGIDELVELAHSTCAAGTSGRFACSTIRDRRTPKSTRTDLRYCAGGYD